MISLTIHLDAPVAAWKKAFDKMNEKIEMAVAAAFLDAKKPRAFTGRNFEIGILLSDDKTIKELNHTYRGQNKPTNVLSFPQMKMEGLTSKTLNEFPGKGAIPLGDIVLAWQTIKKECKEQDKSLENHVIHLTVHGTLHLLGYDHMKVKDAKIMEKLECDILESLGYPDPYHAIAPPQKRKR